MPQQHLQWRSKWEGDSEPPAHARIPPPPHPTYDLLAAVQHALDEDAGLLGDVTSLATVPADRPAIATFLAKAPGVVAGLAVADIVFELVDPSLRVEWAACDGDVITSGQCFGTLTGSARSILRAERVALNFMQRMSGIATATAAMVEAAKPHKARILETRKTVPGLRLPDKWAVLIGGGVNHRVGLYDMMMIKDNHIAAAGGIPAAVHAAQAYLQQHSLQGLPVELETRTLEEVNQALACLRDIPDCCVTRVMLDNMARKDTQAEGGVDVTLLKEAVGLLQGKVETEASGNVTLASVHAIAATGVDYVSCGALTHSVTALDISLNIHT